MREYKNATEIIAELNDEERVLWSVTCRVALKIRRYIFHQLQGADIDDLKQETFCFLFENREKFNRIAAERGYDDGVKARYMFGAAYLNCIDILKRKRGFLGVEHKRRVSVSPELFNYVQDNAYADELIRIHEAFEAAMRRLPDDVSREYIRLRYYAYGKQGGEKATRVLGVSKRKTWNAHNAFKKLLEEEYLARGGSLDELEKCQIKRWKRAAVTDSEMSRDEFIARMIPSFTD